MAAVSPPSSPRVRKRLSPFGLLLLVFTLLLLLGLFLLVLGLIGGKPPVVIRPAESFVNL